ncbi:alpha/beta fold hydrolase [Pseudooceanicola sp. C21-150M6]|uniref:alpha/beta fold hydrolase n=1 Tax=Pseudooceanicola sp. C21-150M6 TaxID=3434355 RepID=UPI003D7F567E
MINISTLILLLVILGAAVAGALVYRSWRAGRRAEAAVPPRGAFVQISTGRLHYLDCGTGPAIVLVHTLDGNLGHFDCGLIDELARNHRVVAIDRPGSGYSERPAGTATNVRAQARLLAEAIEVLELESPLLVGHSMGGSIALALALEKPDLICGLALLAPLTLPIPEVPDVFSDYESDTDFRRKLRSWTTGIPHRVKHSGVVLKQFFGPEQMPSNFLTTGGGLLSLRPSAMIQASRDFATVQDDLPGMARDYARLQVPVRILFGQNDRVLDPELHGHKLVNRHPQIGLELTPGGHMLPVTQPDICVEFVARAAEAFKGRRLVSRASPEVYR